jgi:hypothetical protein
MITRRAFAGLVLGGVALAALSGCGQRRSFRYKMRVEVETPDGVRSGTAVREVLYSEPGNLPSIGESRPQWRVKGEAVAVDLPGGKVLFALLTSGDGVFDYAGRDIDFLFRELGGKEIQLWPNPPKTVSPHINNPLPMLVTFKDVKDPTSVQRADPDDLSASFGKGYALKAITVQVTDEAVTMRVEKRLPKPPYSRTFIYDGEESEALDLSKGKKVTEVIGSENFIRGTTK